MLYVHPTTIVQKIDSSAAFTQSGLNLTADCSGDCSEAGYDGYPNYISCNNGNWDFSIFLPGEEISESEILNNCSLSVDGTPLDLSNCVLNAETKPCGDIGFANYYFQCQNLGSCASESSTLTLTCEGYNQGGPCDYQEIVS